LFWIAVCAVVAPLLAGLLPRRLIPEVVLLLALGVVIGPGVLGLAAVGEGLEVLRELDSGCCSFSPRPSWARGRAADPCTDRSCFRWGVGS
jgi:hypothetical protein